MAGNAPSVVSATSSTAPGHSRRISTTRPSRQRSTRGQYPRSGCSNGRRVGRRTCTREAGAAMGGGWGGGRVPAKRVPPWVVGGAADVYPRKRVQQGAAGGE